MAEPIKVFIFVEHSLVRAGLSKILAAEPNFTIAGYAHKNVEATRKAIELKPDVMVVDISAHNNGFEVLEKIKQILPDVKLMVFTDSARETDLLELVRLGVSSYLPQSATSREIVSTLIATAEGKAVLSSDVAARLLDELRLNSGGVMLSIREEDVLQMVSDGLTNAEIAQRLYISENTVRSHIHRLSHKLGLRNRVEVANYAHSHAMCHHRNKAAKELLSY